ncbi:MAG: threonine synthase [Candidatus Hadarchaeota archaeon]
MLEYISTRGNYEKVSASKAIKLGMVPNGGLFVPEKIPEIEMNKLYKPKTGDYRTLALEILNKFLQDFSKSTLNEVINSSYRDNFDIENVVSLKRMGDRTHLLELWHGPTGAFKDIPLQFMPKLLSKSLDNETAILVATSGDTGKAALEGFKNVDDIYIIVFYPEGGVSEIQELQMTTTKGENTASVALEGSFDDCQRGVKEIFSDKEFKSEFHQNFSSANSINWGRLVPQIVYWFFSYLKLTKNEKIEKGEKIDIVVPTGNFGNILSAYYAKEMGLPINKLICASNENNVLTDFIRTGLYDTDRKLKHTISPAMDILISSNLERFLFHVSGNDSNKINSWYSSLEKNNKFTVKSSDKEKMSKIIHGEFATEEETLETISKIYQKRNYLLDPHTAVGVKCFEKYHRKAKNKRTTIIASTAHPFKFAPAVLKALEDGRKKKGLEAMDKLTKLTGWDPHWGLKNLQGKKIRNKYTCSKTGIREIVRKILKN